MSLKAIDILLLFSEILSNFNNIFKKKSFKIQIGEYENVYEKLNDMKANDAMTK